LPELPYEPGLLKEKASKGKVFVKVPKKKKRKNEKRLLRPTE